MKKNVFTTVTIIFIALIVVLAANSREYHYEFSSADCISISYIYPTEQEDDMMANPSYQAFDHVLSEWGKNHPEINIEKYTYLPSQYNSQISCQAAIQKLPDIFVYQQCNTKAWTDMGLLLNVSDATFDYDESNLKPLTRDGEVYGFPAYNISASIICYDETELKKLGYKEFPITWSELFSAEKKFEEARNINNDSSLKNQSISNCLISFGSGKDSANASARDVLFTLWGRKMGTKWLDDMTTGDLKSSFINSDFIDTVDETGDLLCSGIFNKDFNVINNRTARERFISGETPAYLGSITDAEYIMKRLKGTNRYKSLRFSELPEDSGETNSSSICAGFNYALGINNNANTRKIELLKDLCRTLTGQIYSDEAWNTMPIYGTTKPENNSLSAFDEVQKSLYHAVYDCTHTPMYSSYLDAAVNDSLNMGYFVDGKMKLLEYQKEISEMEIARKENPPHVTTARDYAYRLQDAYEANYLTRAGY